MLTEYSQHHVSQSRLLNIHYTTNTSMHTSKHWIYAIGTQLWLLNIYYCQHRDALLLCLLKIHNHQHQINTIMPIDCTLKPTSSGTIILPTEYTLYIANTKAYYYAYWICIIANTKWHYYAYWIYTQPTPRGTIMPVEYTLQPSPTCTLLTIVYTI